MIQRYPILLALNGHQKAYERAPVREVQSGYTLIELAIVVMLISIVSSLAVPAYQEYTIRTRVSEAAAMSGAAKMAIDMAYAEGYTVGGMPSQTSLGLASPGSYRSKYVISVMTDADGIIDVRLAADNALGPASNGLVTFTPTAQGGNLRWTRSCNFSLKFCPRD